jgi:hypothetical protein
MSLQTLRRREPLLDAWLEAMNRLGPQQPRHDGSEIGSEGPATCAVVRPGYRVRILVSLRCAIRNRLRRRAVTAPVPYFCSGLRKYPLTKETHPRPNRAYLGIAR